MIESNFQTLLFLAYWQMFSLLILPAAIVVVTLFTMANLWAHQGFPLRIPIDSPEGWALFLGTVVLSSIMATFISSIIRQSAQRQELVEELEATRRDLAASERSAGVIGERQRIAGEVHDTIAQDFTSIVMQLEAAEARLGGDTQVAANIALAKQLARDGLAESRRIVYALRPEILNGTTLQDALAQQAARWSRESQIPHEFQVSGDVFDVPREVEVVVFRGLQEALANVYKHATARNVRITLSWLDDEVILDVRDNGTGYDLAKVHGGVGLATMQERVATVGGRVVIETAIGEGTTVSLAVEHACASGGGDCDQPGN
ncbi:MAG: sensor histidine kinase [Thermomicrobiales bacterium]